MQKTKTELVNDERKQLQKIQNAFLFKKHQMSEAERETLHKLIGHNTHVGTPLPLYPALLLQKMYDKLQLRGALRHGGK